MMKGRKGALSDISKGARTGKEIEQMARGSGRANKLYNINNAALFPSISSDHVIIDSLHLFLRISDNPANLLMLELRSLDAIEKSQTFYDGFKRSKYKHMAGWESFLDTSKFPSNGLSVKIQRNSNGVT